MKAWSPGASRRPGEDTLSGEMSYLSELTWVLGAYLLGAVPFGMLIARARGVDITIDQAYSNSLLGSDPRNPG